MNTFLISFWTYYKCELNCVKLLIIFRHTVQTLERFVWHPPLDALSLQRKKYHYTYKNCYA